ncbi:hypothetical protein BX285_1414 [Streptomyces sp. 1114.5]|uniref:hypothetical protein n=1 Tax=unclassified Streptomyces TaxID=2593676 RepID=UPI000BC390FF|nr:MULTISPECIES: hypothetical protein [unclassified Streptomyces]RKT17050.1 hypothetical protein BX285_1414 [Streptomyces sp. 1114.5]SOB83261.1 hypothetical protein SAMN06272789_3463 [Streptomyces sp. 1331.2]
MPVPGVARRRTDGTATGEDRGSRLRASVRPFAELMTRPEMVAAVFAIWPQPIPPLLPLYQTNSEEADHE